MVRGLAGAVAMLMLLVIAGAAQAASGTYTCANLQAGLNQADDGDTITLQGICTGQHFDLPTFPTPSAFPNNYKMWTFRGDPSDGPDGFDGTGLTTAQRMLTGVDVHRLEIQNLTFRDGNVAGNGGALDITGESSVGLRQSAFYNNQATGKGGAVHLSQVAPFLGSTLGGFGVSSDTFGSETVPGEGNSAATGGALSIESPGQGNNNSGINGSTFANNSATGNGGGFDYAVPSGGSENVSLDGNVVVKNKAGGSGGGGRVSIDTGLLRVDNDRYENNSVEPVTNYLSGDHFGGGLYLQGGLPILRHNVFRSNAIKAFTDGGNYGGGGLAISGPGLHVQSEYTRVEGNTLAGPLANTQFESEGGGIFFSSDGGRWEGFLDAVAGNSVGVGGEGGGIYIGAGPAPASLELAETTIAGNTSGGQFAGISGGAQDDLLLWNSIVYNGAPGDIGGFDHFDIQYSDACNDGPSPFAGPGNICADPKLVGGSDIHQTPSSPTIDKGSDELYNMSGGGERNAEDYEGDPRPTDGDGDGHTVDMGADESPAFVAGPPPPPHTPQCSDGHDNDGDGAIDGADPGCLAGPTDDNEGDETPGDLVLCGSREISLVRADVKGSKVSLSGFVATKHAGEKVTLSVRYLGKGGKPAQLGSVTANGDGSFKGRVKKPSRKLFKVGRYRAQVGSAKSVELKLPQSLASTSLKRVAGGMLELRGQVDRPLLGKGNPVVVKRILCGKYTTVGQAKPDKKGRYAVRFAAPATTTGSALYRAETRVLARPGSKRYVKQFARAIGITF